MKRILQAALIILSVGGAVWWFAPEQALIRRTNNLLDTISFSEGTGKAARNLKTYPLNRLLAERVRLETPTIPQANGEFDRSDLGSGFNWLCNRARQSKFKSAKVHSAAINGDSATVEMDLKGLVELPAYRPVDGTFKVTFDWQREDDDWRLVRANCQQIP